MTELLAPAKDKYCAFAAIDFGADAVYVGAPKFGARKSAANSVSDIKEIVDYAHKFYAKVYVTLNTILTDDEIKTAKDLILKLYNIGVDALIIQDMGIMEMAANKEIPPIPLHASTQCDFREIDKVKFFENCGVSRVILARELSLTQINEICKKLAENSELTAPIEVETFVHGALCLSYSGQCYLSYANGGRSANRGECAQPCRKTYSLIDEDGNVIAKDKYLLSLKDFNAANHLKKLAKFGVKSFKIEGRLKDENYVKNVVGYYYKLIKTHDSSGFVTFDKEPDVNKVFNREFSDYFLEMRKKCYNFDSPKAVGEFIGKITAVGKDYFVLKNDFLPQDGLCFEGGGCLVNKTIGDKVYPNKMDGIKVQMAVYRNKTDANISATRKIACQIVMDEKTLSAKDEDGNLAKISYEFEEFAQNPQKMKENIEKQLKKSGESDFCVQKVVSLENNLPFLQVSKLNELRRTLLSKLMKERLKNYKKKTSKTIAPSPFPTREADYRANVSNSLAEKFYEKCDCKITEKALETGVSTKDKELMRTKHCLKFAFDMCKNPKKLFLIDEKGKKYALKFDCKNCEMVIMG